MRTRMRGFVQAGGEKPPAIRLLEIIRMILRRAQLGWEWIDRLPAIRLQPNPVRRIRWLKHEEADRLLSILPPHQAAPVRFDHGAAREECDAIGMVAGRSDTPYGVDPPRPSQG